MDFPLQMGLNSFFSIIDSLNGPTNFANLSLFLVIPFAVFVHCLWNHSLIIFHDAFPEAFRLLRDNEHYHQFGRFLQKFLPASSYSKYLNRSRWCDRGYSWVCRLWTCFWYRWAIDSFWFFVQHRWGVSRSNLICFRAYWYIIWCIIFRGQRAWGRYRTWSLSKCRVACCRAPHHRLYWGKECGSKNISSMACRPTSSYTYVSVAVVIPSAGITFRLVSIPAHQIVQQLSCHIHLL